MTPTLLAFEGATVIGIEIRTSNAVEADPAKGKIGPLWARFRGQHVLDAIPGKTMPVVPFGVYHDYEGDETAPYRLVAGAAVQPGTKAPDGMARVEIPAGRYLVFRAEGQLPGVGVETWKAIWAYFSGSAEHARAYATDFERYPESTIVEIHISVK